MMLFTGAACGTSPPPCAAAPKVAGKDHLVDELVIQQVHDEQVEDALCAAAAAHRRPPGRDRRGRGEHGRLPPIIAADVALKTATVDLFDLRIANGLDGKSFLSVTGPVADGALRP